MIAHARLLERLLQFFRGALVLADLVEGLPEVVAEFTLVWLGPHARLGLEQPHFVEFLFLFREGGLRLRLLFRIGLLGQGLAQGLQFLLGFLQPEIADGFFQGRIDPASRFEGVLEPLDGRRVVVFLEEKLGDRLGMKRIGGLGLMLLEVEGDLVLDRVGRLHHFGRLLQLLGFRLALEHLAVIGGRFPAAASRRMGGAGILQAAQRVRFPGCARRFSPPAPRPCSPCRPGPAY